MVIQAPSFARSRPAEIRNRLRNTFLQLSTLVRSCQSIDAKVPILKMQLTTRYGGFDVDFSFGNNNGVEGARVMNRLLADMSAAGDGARVERLVYMIKLLLSEKRLNETRFGGLGGMSIFLLVVSFVQMQTTERMRSTPGHDLIEFLDLYGRTFDFRRYTITTRLGGGYLDRARTFPGPANYFSLQHPVDLRQSYPSPLLAWFSDC